MSGLEWLGPTAGPALREFLAGRPSPEARTRADALLRRITRPAVPLTDPEDLRAARTVEVLEQIGTDPAREALRELSGGAAGARLTEAARAALSRLGRHQSPGR